MAPLQTEHRNEEVKAWLKQHHTISSILGGGPGGYVAAIRAAQLGQKVAVVERENLGGVCLNWGCIPTKSLLRNAEIANILSHEAKEFGFSFDNLKLDYAVAQKRSRQVSERLVKGIGFLFRKNNITHIQGTATLIGPKQVKVEPSAARCSRRRTSSSPPGAAALAAGHDRSTARRSSPTARRWS